MREIKFRAKEIGFEGKWRVGDLHMTATEPHIHSLSNKYLIKIETIGQCTCLHDKNGKAIYEGDIVRYSLDAREDVGYIGFHARSASFRVIAEHTDFGIGNRGGLYEPNLEVIGNIHDNPELLKKSDMKKLQNNFTTPEQSKRLLELGVPAWTADCFYSESGKIEIKNTALYGLYPSCWSVGRLIEILNICSMWGNVSIHRTDREVTQIEQLIEILQNRINGKTIDFQKLKE